MLDRISAFTPIVDQYAKVLILGSMPSITSLEKQEYYAHAQNRFWKIIFELFDAVPETNYEKKKMFVKSKGLAIWDVIASCYREGSLDTKIKDEKTNDFEELFKQYPSIKYVVFNGAKAHEIFNKKVKCSLYPALTFKKLTSTSPANTISYEKKLADWEIIKEYLKE